MKFFKGFTGDLADNICRTPLTFLIGYIADEGARRIGFERDDFDSLVVDIGCRMAEREEEIEKAFYGSPYAMALAHFAGFVSALGRCGLNIKISDVHKGERTH